MFCQKYHFKKSVSCISLLSVIVSGFYLLWTEWPVIKYHLDSTGIVSFRNAGFLFLFTIIMLVVTVFSASVGVSGNHEVHSQIVIPGVVISVFLQFTAIMIIKAWAWSPYALAGTFLIVQFWSGYLTGWVQRDLNEGRGKTGFWNIVSEFWLLIPLVLSGWGLSWGYYTTLFTL
ncbi:hypothetical protein [Escherichia coli]|uniref:hypothetical protein n=1 Tax=Escherichia coli TaxID=562 RepID=UPI0002C9EE31|nr:hypothetical protein [Escherichia coli]ENF56032.1 putative membrane protein [Escherichia coli P0304816.7]